MSNVRVYMYYVFFVCLERGLLSDFSSAVAFKNKFVPNLDQYTVLNADFKVASLSDIFVCDSFFNVRKCIKDLGTSYYTVFFIINVIFLCISIFVCLFN